MNDGLKLWPLTLLVALAGCVAAGPAFVPMTAPGTRISLRGYSVVSPSGEGWLVSQRGQFDIGYIKTIGSRTHTFGLTAAGAPFTLRFDTPQDFLEYVKKSKETGSDPKRFRTLDRDATIDPTHGSYCVRYHEKVEDHAAANAEGSPYLILEAWGVACVSPLSPALVVDIGYHDRYKPGELPGPVQEGEQFIDSLQFGPSDPLAKLNVAENLFMSQDRPQPAERLIREAIVIYQERDDPTGLGHAHREYADLLRSRSVAVKWEKFYRENGFQDPAVTFDNRLAKSSEYYTKAIGYYQRAEKQDREANRFDALTNVYFNMAWSYLMLEDRAQACAYYDRTLEAYAENIRRNPDAKPISSSGTIPDVVASAKKRAQCATS